MAFLGVETSLTGRRWVGPSGDLERAAAQLSQRSALPPAVCQILAARGVTHETVPAYLSPSIRDLLPDPRSLRDMEVAAARFLTAVQRRERIAIFADYDVDGGASAALLMIWLSQRGQQATLYVPDRVDEGYGPNEAAMAHLAARHDLIICVDCGTLSHGPIDAAVGADVIVLDHHLAGETLPKAAAVVNPNRQDEDGALAHLCAAAVVFLMLVEAGRQLRAGGTQGPDLMALLDLVGLATVADVAPLVGVNRAFVRQGLRVMARRERPGLTALSDVARLDTAPTSYHLGFVLGPRINAGGRIGQADLGARLLAAQTQAEAQPLAEKLDTLNTARRMVEEAVRAEALAQADARGFDGPLVWACGAGWHPGVVGIVASRLKDAANRPAIVIGVENGIGKGSGRSISGIDLGASIQRVAAEGLLLKGGGHKMAAGLTVAEDQIAPAMHRLGELIENQGAHAQGAKDLRITGLMTPEAASVELIEQIEQAGPFGAGSPAPRYVFADMQIQFAKRVGEKHLKLRFGHSVGPRLDAIGFGAFETPLGPHLEAHDGGRFHLSGRVEINVWQGRRTVQLRLDDAAMA
ncbi:MAG: single-stranded-DNA-specific exonuclease RecJ [Pseudomonadota bacterium]